MLILLLYLVQLIAKFLS